MKILTVALQETCDLLVRPGLHLLDFIHGAFQRLEEFRPVAGRLANVQLDVSPVDLW